ncbi:NUDIX hydrolase [Kitasatospora sp. NPDC096147]|uniref:NUDIX hydrolase n=1 Tax=Kitasatospora sp. NPDC096147 TaxID=3364093 RepID=UPI0037F692E0
MTETVKRSRVAAYVVCVDGEDRMLLARGVLGDGSHEWTVPGGGLDHGEPPQLAAVREAEEETGHLVELDALLGVDSRHLIDPPFLRGPARDFHSLRIVYAARVVGGELRPEADGSTDLAAWIPIGDIPGLRRADLVDVALALYRERPALGLVELPTAD